jgi:hypothetical protein
LHDILEKLDPKVADETVPQYGYSTRIVQLRGIVLGIWKQPGETMLEKMVIPDIRPE